MMKNRCEVCDRPTKRKTLCEAHYYRLRRTGTTGPAEVWDRERKPCSVNGCGSLAEGLGLCSKHRQRLNDTGQIELRDRPAGENHPQWKGDEVGYIGAHIRVRKAFGRAKDHVCECGEQAAHWALRPGRGTHLGEVSSFPSRKFPYSTDPTAYVAMCVPCHKKMDLLNR